MKLPLRLFLCLTLALLVAAAPVARVWAEEGEKPADNKEGDKEKKKGGDEGGEGEKKKGADDVSGGRFAGDPVYVHLAPMVMPIITDNGVEQLVTIAIDIQVKDFDTADTLHSNMPKVMDALMRALYGGLGQGTLRNGKLVDIAKIKAKATAALTAVIGDGIKDVLIQGVAQRML